MIAMMIVYNVLIVNVANDLPGNARSLTAWKRVGAVDYGNPESINRAVVGRP